MSAQGPAQLSARKNHLSGRSPLIALSVGGYRPQGKPLQQLGERTVPPSTTKSPPARRTFNARFPVLQPGIQPSCPPRFRRHGFGLHPQGFVLLISRHPNEVRGGCLSLSSDLLKSESHAPSLRAKQKQSTYETKKPGLLRRKCSLHDCRIKRTCTHHDAEYVLTHISHRTRFRSMLFLAGLFALVYVMGHASH